jgi:hypothetical protein
VRGESSSHQLLEAEAWRRALRIEGYDTYALHTEMRAHARTRARVHTHTHTHTHTLVPAQPPLCRSIRPLVDRQPLPPLFPLPLLNALSLAHRDSKLSLPGQEVTMWDLVGAPLSAAAPSCGGGGKGMSPQRLHKYLLSSNTAGSRAPSSSRLICHPREISAEIRAGLLELSTDPLLALGCQMNLPNLSV